MVKQGQLRSKQVLYTHCRYGDLLNLDDDQEAPFRISEQENGTDKGHKKFMETLKVHVALNDQSLSLETDESYALDISAPHSRLTVRQSLLPLRYRSQSSDERLILRPFQICPAS